MSEKRKTLILRHLLNLNHCQSKQECSQPGPDGGLHVSISNLNVPGLFLGDARWNYSGNAFCHLGTSMLSCYEPMQERNGCRLLT